MNNYNKQRSLRLKLGLGCALGLSLLPGASMALEGTPTVVTPPISPTQTFKPGWDTYSDTWVGTYVDTSGNPQPLPMGSAAKGPRADRTVGIFYFLSNNTPKFHLYDNSQILAANPTNPTYGPVNAPHWWGEPVLGHYASADPAVIRKHMQMLSDAGVDVLIFDASNVLTYPDVYVPILDVMRSMRQVGLKTPQITFLTARNESNGISSYDRVYDAMYSKNMYADLWFRWKDDPNSTDPARPFLLLHTANKAAPSTVLTTEENNFFSSRYSWAWDPGQGHWDWTEFSLQRGGSFDSNDKLEEVSVSVASHPVLSLGRSYVGNFSRGTEPEVDQYHLTPQRGLGLYFDQQWKQALKLDPRFVFVTGWNEWTAQRFIATGDGTYAGLPSKSGDTYFVDAFNAEFSRDIEPSTDPVLGDNYYYDLVKNVRLYKGARTLSAVAARPIAIDGKFKDWQNASPEFRDTVGDPVQRDYDTWGQTNKVQNHIINHTGRNDIVVSKVSFDSSNVYFYARAREAITAPGKNDKNWMLLYIDADKNPLTGWLGYDYVVNRVNVGTGTTTLEKNVGGQYQWESPATISYRVRGSEIEIAIPRAALGITGLPATLDFKWADNSYAKGDATDFTLNGDAAPNDRFNYRAMLK